MKALKKLSPVATLSFMLSFSVCLFVIVGVMYGRSNEERHKMNQLITEKGTRINETISRLMYKTQVLSALVIQSDGQIDSFERVAAIIFDDPAIMTFAIAPDGVITDVYPFEENKDAIGFDLLDPALTGNKEAIMAKKRGEFVFGGPFEYIQGGQGLAGRMPVYLDSPEGGRYFWGIVSISLRYPQALEGAGLDEIAQQGYSYEIWRINPDDNQKQVIARGGADIRSENSRFIEERISVQNADWYFRIAPVRKWYEYPETWSLILVGGGISFFISIAVRKNEKLSAANREVRQRLESIIQTAPVAYMLTLEDRIVEINDVMKDYTGLSAGEDARLLYAEPEKRGVIIERLAREGVIRNEVIRYNTAEGESHRSLLSSADVEYGQERAHAVWMVDIEDNELRIDQLRAARQDLQTLLDLLPIPVRILNIENKTVSYVNKSCLALFECDSYDQMNGRPIAEAFPKFQSDGTPSSKKIAKITDSLEPFSVEVEYLSAKGNIIDALLTSFKIGYNGRWSAVSVIRDIAQERREAQLRSAAREAEAASRAKSVFIANMSHEIRTPMNSIVGFSELALDGDVPEETRDYLEKIKVSSDLLLQVIDSILDMSKIESGKMHLEYIPFGLHDVFRVCHTIVAPKALEKSIALYCYAEPPIGKKLMGDPTKLRQAILNLLTNAVKFTDSGMVKLLAAIESVSGDNVAIRFEIKDSGIGMSKEQLDRVFEPFVQADESTTRQYGGTGLGLAIARGMIELMGGKLTAESTPGVGTKFSFVLTFKAVDEVDTPKNNAESLPREKPIFDGEVLLCEDNRMNRQMVCEHLSRVGLRTVIAKNGREGVEIVRSRIEKNEKAFDLILMDIHMPVMDGLEAAEALAGIGNKTPIVALTANVMAGDREIYRSHGMPDHVPKPFKAWELWACLLKYLKPVKMEAVAAVGRAAADEEQRGKYMRNFVQDHRDDVREIAAALEDKDSKLAHRLAHTLKSVAGLIEETELASAAHAVERILKNDPEKYSTKQMGELMHVLELEMDGVLGRIPSTSEAEEPPSSEGELDRKKVRALFEKLEQMLKSHNADCLDLVENLRTVPETGVIIEQMEQYSFGEALETLGALRQSLGL